MLLGSVGELAGGTATFQPSAHALLTNQCVTCHMQTEEYGGESHPAMTGHSFKVEIYEACLECHPFPEMFIEFTSTYVSDRLNQLKQALDSWATTRAPLALRTKYGARAWEYTSAGDYYPNQSGPNATEQGQVPTSIKKARFNLYLVRYDGSLGIHNGPFAIRLLDAADDWVQQELSSDD